MRANRDSWKREPFETGLPLDFSLDVTPEEIQLIHNGLIPQAMEDKWFIYFEEPYLYFHRSWTGDAVYRATLVSENGKSQVTDVQYCTEALKDAEHEARLFEFLISNLVLGKQLPFPKAEEPDNTPPGIQQHAFSGTGYEETPVRGKPWWKFW